MALTAYFAVDPSVMPRSVRVNANAPTIKIAETATDSIMVAR
jgi:choline dehydrogenase-like flavoprotein